MTKTITSIKCPERWSITNDWDSHRPLLWLSVTNNSKSICEFGCGNGSTKLLNAYCKKNVHTFNSYETNDVYAKRFGGIVTLVNDYDDVQLSSIPHREGVLFIDLSPGEQRKEMIKKHANNVDVIVVHDTEPSAEYVYGMKEILSTFKYRLDFQPEGFPHTTAVSNFINVTEWV